MTLRWSKTTGRASADLRAAAFGRLHIQLGTKKTGEASLRYAALVAFVKAATPDEIAQLRARRIRLDAIVRAHREQRSFTTLAPAHHWPTLGDAIDRYLEAYEANPKRRPSSYRHAKHHLEVIRRIFGGDRRLDALRADEIDAFRLWLTTAGGRTGTGIRPHSAELYIERLTALFNWTRKREERAAREERRVARVLHVPVDPESVLREKPARERFLLRHEAAAVLEATPAAWMAAVCLGLYAGLRAGETLFLSPTDVNFEAGTLFIREKTLPDGSIWKPKSKTSRREIPIAPTLETALRTHLSLGRASSEWLFPSAYLAGYPVSDDTLGLAIGRIVRDAGLVYGADTGAGVTYHTLRHTFASWLVMQGVDLHTVAKLLGHTDTKMVERTYGHLAPDHKRRAVGQLESVFVLDSMQKTGALTP